MSTQPNHGSCPSKPVSRAAGATAEGWKAAAALAHDKLDLDVTVHSIGLGGDLREIGN